MLIRALVPLTGVALASCGTGVDSNSSAQRGSASASSGFDRVAATAQVTLAWQSFFAETTPVREREALLENGTTTMMPAVQAFATDPRVGQAAATVQNVTFPSPTEADVTYQISLNGVVVEEGMAGMAVDVGGRWLVADATLCGLLELAAAQGAGSAAAIPGCS
jgi:hypothetical protein